MRRTIIAGVTQHIQKYVQQRRRLSPDALLVLAAHTLFLFGVSLSGIYVNIFLFQAGQSLSPVAWYHLYHYIALGVGVIVAGHWAERTDRLRVLRISVVLHAVFFALILYLSTTAVSLVRELGILLGIGTAFYWLAHYTLAFDVTDDTNRDYFQGLFLILTSLATTVAPFVAGAVIVRMHGLTGYRLVFGLSVLCLAASMFVSMFLPSKPSDRSFQLLRVLWAHDNDARRQVLWIQGINGLRNGVFLFLVSLLLYSMTENELVVGGVVLVGGLVALGMSWLVGRRTRPEVRSRPLLAGFFGLGLAVVILSLNVSPAGIVLFSLVEALFGPMYHIPFGSLSYSAIENDPEAGALRIEYIAAQELVLNIGRTVGVGALLVFGPGELTDPAHLGWFIGVIGLIPLLGWRSHVKLTGRAKQPSV